MATGTQTVGELMLAILSDGMPHTKEELHKCCGPSNRENVSTHICLLRKVLRPKGEDVICEYANRIIYYRHVRLLNNPYTG